MAMLDSMLTSMTVSSTQTGKIQGFPVFSSFTLAMAVNIIQSMKPGHLNIMLR